MNDQQILLPSTYTEIQFRSKQIDFSMPSDEQTGSLLRTLISSKPKGDFLELGTGTGLSLSWIVEAMDNDSSVISVDNNETYQAIAKSFYDGDERISFICDDGNKWILENQNKRFDLIFADAWPGKYDALNETLNLLKPGGLYIIDDMLHQPNWPAGHEDNVIKLVEYLEQIPSIRFTKMNWSTGIVIVSKIA